MREKIGKKEDPWLSFQCPFCAVWSKNWGYRLSTFFAALQPQQSVPKRGHGFFAPYVHEREQYQRYGFPVWLVSGFAKPRAHVIQWRLAIG